MPVTPAVRKSHRVITLDLKGFGFTDRPEGDYSPDAQARIVLALMDRLDVPNAAVVAHSWGSSVALALALKAPTRVRRLAMYDAWVYEEQLPVFFHWARAGGLGEAMFASYYRERAEDRLALAFFDKSYITEALVENVNEALDRPGAVAAALAAVRGQRYADVQERYKKVTQKTLLLWGRDDVVTRLLYGERLAHELPNASMIVYPRCGHFPMIEALSASNRDLAKFLDEEVTSSSKDESGPSTPAQTHSPSGAAF
jgi:pimeloyl-ACP methyl ester carboxylesterase